LVRVLMMPLVEVSVGSSSAAALRQLRWARNGAVTGGAGFLGSHLCTYLVERGDEVLCLDNYFTGDKDNIFHLRGHPNFEVIRHDIVESILIEERFFPSASLARPPVLSTRCSPHLRRLTKFTISPAPPPPCTTSSTPSKLSKRAHFTRVLSSSLCLILLLILRLQTNVMGTLNMLGLAKRVNARFLLASTSEVYGDPEKHPQPESYWGNVNPIGERSCYDEGKRVAETCVHYTA